MRLCSRHIFFAVIATLLFHVSTFALSENRDTESTGNEGMEIMPDVTSEDSVAHDTIPSEGVVPKTKKKTALTAPVYYSAQDSIVMYRAGNAYMYGNSDVKYDQMKLNAAFIHLNTDSSIVDASGIFDEKDSVMAGEPVFTDNGQDYHAKTIQYNFNTKKGFVRQALLQQGDGYVVGKETKKVDDDIFFMKNGHYTTCDHHDSPHYYLNLTKAKVKQKKWVVTGPAYLVIADIPLPLAIPFGYFPFTHSYSSGVIMPTYGDELTRGFYLRDGGYYFAINDYMDLTLLGDIYTNGTWALGGGMRYVKRYKFNGNFNVNYRVDKYGLRELENEYYEQKNFNIIWTHSQNPKSMPNSTFSASVNFSSSGYDRANVSNYYNASVLSQDTKSSSVSFSHNFPNSPFSLSTSLLASQRTSDSTVALTLPDLTFTMNRVYPLKRKTRVGKDRWWEKLYVSYNGNFKNEIETKENKVLHSSLSREWKNGMNHTVPVGMSFNVLKYLSITPAATYHSCWYMQKVNQSWDYATNTVAYDTVSQFNRVWDFNTSVSASTKLYGFFKPVKWLGGNKIDRIRHVFTPTVSLSYHPDFSTDWWGYYETYSRPVSATDPTLYDVTYSPFSNNQFGVPASGKSGSVNFSINNNVEMKWRTTNDTTGEDQFKKISLIDALAASTSYNLAADSLRWSNINANLRLKLTKSMTFNLNGTFDQYYLELNEYNNVTHVDKMRWEEGELPRLINTSTSLSYSISNKTFNRAKREESGKEEDIKGLTTANVDEEMNKANAEAKRKADTKKGNEKDDLGYAKFTLPWTLSFDYSMRYGNTTEIDTLGPVMPGTRCEYVRELTHNLGIRATISPTSNWNLSAGISYDCKEEKIAYSTISVSRNLHCWNMSANIVPFGPYKSYNFLVQVSSDMLADLKYEQSSDYSYYQEWY